MKKTGFMIVLMLLLWSLVGCSSQATMGEKDLIIDILGADGYENQYILSTDEEYLGDVLAKTEIAEMEEGSFGRFITTVDGYTADATSEYWSIIINDEYATKGADELAISDGDTICLALATF